MTRAGALLCVVCALGEACAAKLCGDISADTVLRRGEAHSLACLTRVRAPATLTIEAGVTIIASNQHTEGVPQMETRLYGIGALIIERGARLVAEGTASEPITFTARFASPGSAEHGLWGGIALLGRAPVQDRSYLFPGLKNPLSAHDSDYDVLVRSEYGGDDADDNSGSLRYVRLWHGGHTIDDKSGIDKAHLRLGGLTLAGVGSATTIEHVEVAHCTNDAFALYGGTAHVRRLSALFPRGGDAFVVDAGYRGRGQYLFGMLGADGDHGLAVESGNARSRLGTGSGEGRDARPRSHPEWFGVTLIGGGVAAEKSTDHSVKLQEGAGGKLGDMVVAHFALPFEVRNCGTEGHVRTFGEWPASDYLYVSPRAILWNAGIGIAQRKTPYGDATVALDQTCTNDTDVLRVSIVDPGLASADASCLEATCLVASADALPISSGEVSTADATFDPRPTETGPACAASKDDPSKLDSFFEARRR